jgi:hypothetical protein
MKLYCITVNRDNVLVILLPHLFFYSLSITINILCMDISEKVTRTKIYEILGVALGSPLFEKYASSNGVLGGVILG